MSSTRSIDSARGRRALDADPPLLAVEQLRVRFPSREGGHVEAVQGISFQVGAEKLGIVGESGSGKSISARSVLRVLPQGCEVTARQIAYRGRNLLELSDRDMRSIRGRHISMIMQDPKFSLNPTMQVGPQIAEMLRTHLGIGRSEARERVLVALQSVRMRDSERVIRAYPHELSGGMGQRVMIAMMLIADSSLLIADEPTSALDVSIQMQILALLDQLVGERGMGLIFISHDIQLVASFCDRVLVMHHGQIVDSCRAADLYRSEHPYTRRLLAATPHLGSPQ